MAFWLKSRRAWVILAAVGLALAFRWQLTP
jgi:hypothetical protein